MLHPLQMRWPQSACHSRALPPCIWDAGRLTLVLRSASILHQQVASNCHPCTDWWLARQSPLLTSREDLLATCRVCSRSRGAKINALQGQACSPLSRQPCQSRQRRRTPERGPPAVHPHPDISMAARKRCHVPACLFCMTLCTACKQCKHHP